ncbi:MAG: radical SAM protein [DPANN group archaeon]|nr:radical SAM protein [DPANN group archaeon]
MEETPFVKEKVLTHYKEIKEIIRGEFPYPRTVHFFISERCNHTCVGCHSLDLHKEEKPFLNLEIFKSLLNQVKDKGVEGVEISGGGEPLMHPKIEEVIRHASKSGLKVGLFTNAILFNEKNAKNILENCFFIRIAFDASNNEEYEKIHQKNDYEKLLKNIELLVKIKNNYNLKTIIGLKVLVSKINYKNILEMSKKAKQLNVDYIQFKCLRNNENEINKEELSIAKKLLAKSKKLSNKDFKVYSSLEKTHIRNQCFTNPLHTLINSNGDVHLCVFFNHIKTPSIGNIYTQSFDDIWNSKKHKKIIKMPDLKLCNIYDCPFHQYNNYAKDLILDNKMHLEFI